MLQKSTFIEGINTWPVINVTFHTSAASAGEPKQALAGLVSLLWDSPSPLRSLQLFDGFGGGLMRCWCSSSAVLCLHFPGTKSR